MCGLFTLRTVPALLMDSEIAKYATDRLKVYPGEEVPVIRLDHDHLEPSLMRWGFRPNWATKSKAQINARSEGIEAKPMFKGSFSSKRCLVPADGFYEPVEGSKPRRYYFFQQSEAVPFYIAGIWTRFSAQGEDPHDTVAIITTTPNEVVAPIHGRMPVILHEEAVSSWLDPEVPQDRLQALLQTPSANALEGWEVSGDLYKKGRQDISCVEPVPVTPRLL